MKPIPSFLMLIVVVMASSAIADDLPERSSSVGSKVRADVLSVNEDERTVTLLVPKVVRFDQLDDRSLAQARRLLKNRREKHVNDGIKYPELVSQSTSQNSGLGRTEKQVLAMLESHFQTFESNTLVDGRHRRMSQTADNMSAIEIIGDQSSPESVTILTGLPKNAPDVTARNAALILQFIKNTLPNWKDSAEWVSESLDRSNRSMDSEPILKSIGNAEISLRVMHNLSLCSVTIKAK